MKRSWITPQRIGISLTIVFLSISCVLARTATKKRGAPKTPAQPAIKWHTYTDQGGFYSLNYPDGWEVLTKGNAVVIKGPGGPDNQGIFGITPRASGITIEESVKKEFSDPDRPKDLVKSMSRIANTPATKVVGSKKGNPDVKVVEYYVQIGSQDYYILFQTPRAAWSHNSDYFDGMIASMIFLK